NASLSSLFKASQLPRAPLPTMMWSRRTVDLREGICIGSSAIPYGPWASASDSCMVVDPGRVFDAATSFSQTHVLHPLPYLDGRR
ncbi:hypothetical protein GW17_00039261, partial [Ensete ventricosum]